MELNRENDNNDVCMQELISALLKLKIGDAVEKCGIITQIFNFGFLVPLHIVVKPIIKSMIIVQVIKLITDQYHLLL